MTEKIMTRFSREYSERFDAVFGERPLNVMEEGDTNGGDSEGTSAIFGLEDVPPPAVRSPESRRI
jgi:hypothetical protein